MIKKEVFTGFGIGLVTNAIGAVLIVFIISLIKENSLAYTFEFFLENDVMWMLISLGALPNLLVFFRLLNKNKEYRARGIVMATLIAAIFAFILYFGFI
jgi:hypothetical protein